jgi:hypothetical protein
VLAVDRNGYRTSAALRETLSPSPLASRRLVSDHDLQLWEPIVELAKTGERADRRLLILDAGSGPYAVLELRVVGAGVTRDQDRAGLGIDEVRHVIR